MLQIMPASEDKTQFNIYITRTTRNRLEALAKQFNMEKGTKVAAEIIETYAEMWAEAEQAKLDVYARQSAAMEKAIKTEMLKLPMKEATADKTPHTVHRRKTR
jgi:spermidine/putrescine-binding protein